ncbi:ATP-binding protein [Mucilaginibacter sp.]|uniref:ATP-binding protein n=1 Tax=Mucilaginibacter sp. TaxID=1882438 RepID=UPI0025D050F9|nr:ATP-binding protein [Mucilaginibacter sp.]
MSTRDIKFLNGGGEMGELIRSTDWSKTPIDSPGTWPQALRTTVSLMLNSLFPMYIGWGSEYTQLYNDGYRPILGATKHPQAMGIGTSETFAEIWHIIGPMFAGVMKGEAVGFPNFMLPLERNGYVEECYFDFCYSPIRHDDGTVGGVLVTVIETTEKYKAFQSLDAAKRELEISQAETKKEGDRLKRFFMQAPAGICILGGQDLVFELVNPLYQQLFPGRNLLGRPLLEAVPEITGQPVWDLLQKVYNSGKTHEGHNLLIPLARTDNGPVEDRYFDFIYQARLNQDNQVDGILVFVYEVTEMVQIHRRVEESEKRFRTMIEQAPVALLVNRGDDLIFDVVNQPMIDMIGKGDGIRGKTWYDALPELVGQPVVDELYNTYRTGEEWRGNEVPIILSNNGEPEQRYFNLIYRPLIEAGKITGLLQSAVDVTGQVNARMDLEQAKDTLNLAISAAELGMFDMDLTKGTLYWDERCRTLFGISHNNPVTYEVDFVEGLHPEDRERVLEVIKNVFDIKVDSGNYDVEYRTVGAEDKKVRWIRAKGKAYFDETEQPVRFIGAVLDITEQKTDEIRKNDFIGMVSHELKTPLTTLTAVLQIASVKLKESDNKPLVTAIERGNVQAKRMTAMIKGFLDISRLESGKMLIEKQKFDMDKLVHEVVDEIKLIEKGHEIKLINCNPVQVNADRDKISSVISNFINNAAKYSPNGKPIAISCEIIENEVIVSVRDEGIGIKQQDLNLVFDRFYRAEAAHKHKISGFGIGLYLSFEIIKQHNGRIWVESEQEVGSTFYFTLHL